MIRHCRADDLDGKLQKKLLFDATFVFAMLLTFSRREFPLNSFPVQLDVGKPPMIDFKLTPTTACAEPVRLSDGM